MRLVVYKVADVETTSYAKKTELEKATHRKAEVILREVEREKPRLSPIRKAMIEQFGYVHPSLKDKVVL